MLSESQKKSLMALISMMDEPDENIYETLKRQVLSFNIDAYPIMEKAWMAAGNLLVSKRLEELMEEINFRFIHKEFKDYILSNDQDMLKPVLLINRLCVPEINTEDLKKELETLVKDSWLEINENLTALEKINVLNHIFYVVHKFSSPKAADDSLPPFFLSHLLSNKTGNPTSMGILYLMVAQFLKIPLLGVNLPGHLIAAYVEDTSWPGEENSYKSSSVMFYVNPFNKGAVFTRSEIDLYIKQLKIKPKENYYTPSSNRLILMRYLKELEKVFKLNNSSTKQQSISKLLDLFNENPA